MSDCMHYIKSTGRAYNLLSTVNIVIWPYALLGLLMGMEAAEVWK